MIKLDKILNEAKIVPTNPNRLKTSYTPEEIDDLVVKGQNFYDKGKAKREFYIDKVRALNLNDLLYNRTEVKTLISQIKDIKRIYDDQYNFLYDVVDLYDFLEAPDNVKKLEKITDYTYELREDMSTLVDILEEILDAAIKSRVG